MVFHPVSLNCKHAYSVLCHFKVSFMGNAIAG
jgi:hypothetical protein